MFISTQKSIGKLIQMMSGENERKVAQCLIDNAIGWGYDEKDIEVKWITAEEWAVMQEELTRPTPEQLAEQERETMIRDKIREMAIAELVKEGRLEAKTEGKS